MSGTWTSSLFGCFDNFGICLVTYFVPCVTFGKTAEAIGMGGCVPCGLSLFVPILNLVMMVKMRSQIRSMHNIPGDKAGDCYTILFCGACALCQEAQQVQASGARPGPQAMSRV